MKKKFKKKQVKCLDDFDRNLFNFVSEFAMFGAQSLIDRGYLCAGFIPHQEKRKEKGVI